MWRMRSRERGEKDVGSEKVGQKTRKDARRTRTSWGSCWAVQLKTNLCVRWPTSGRPCHSHWWLTVVLQKQSYRGRESEGSKRGVFYTTADGSTVENEGEKTLIMSTADGPHLRKVTFQVATVNKAYGSVSKMVRNGNRVVFDTSGRTSRTR